MNNSKGLTRGATSVIIHSIELPTQRGIMDEQELASLLKDNGGWTYQIRYRRKHTPYIYAKRHEGARYIERYIAPLSKINTLTHTQVINKLVTLPKMQTAVSLQALQNLRLTA